MLLLRIVDSEQAKLVPIYMCQSKSWLKGHWKEVTVIPVYWRFTSYTLLVIAVPVDKLTWMLLPNCDWHSRFIVILQVDTLMHHYKNFVAIVRTSFCLLYLATNGWNITKELPFTKAVSSVYSVVSKVFEYMCPRTSKRRRSEKHIYEIEWIKRISISILILFYSIKRNLV